METEDSVEDDGNEFVAQADKLASMIVRIRIWNLFITGIGAELPYIGAAEEKDTLYKYLKSISTDEEYAEIASRILDEWLSESDGS